MSKRENRKRKIERHVIVCRAQRSTHRNPRVNAAKLVRRRFLRLVAGTAAITATSRLAWPQAYPARPVTMIVPLAAGSLTDVVGRILTERMRGPLGQPVVIENVTGADGNIGLGRVARARPDGYTIDIGAIGPHVLNGAMYSLTYDLLNDFEPICPLITAPLFLFAKTALPANDLNELIAWLNANPKSALAGFNAPGPHVVTALFQKETGASFIHVPYRGLAMPDLVSGRIDLLFDTVLQLPLARAGKIKAFAVTSDTRIGLAPDIATFGELGWRLSYSAWIGMFAPKGTPKNLIDKLNSAAVEALADPMIRSRLLELGQEIFPLDQQTPEALRALVKDDAAKWWPIIQEAGIKIQ
jgi:tripartite-type tricarboxylate transporter receptor subunit TctC